MIVMHFYIIYFGGHEEPYSSKVDKNKCYKSIVQIYLLV
jgi:hypothetical protein